MKRKKRVFTFWVCICLCVPCEGIVPAFASGKGDGTIQIVPIVAKDLQSPDYDLLEPTEDTVSSKANDFALRLSAMLLQEAGDENFVCSPYSVWMPLAALVNAVDEPYRSEMLAALNAASVEEEELNQAASRMLYDLSGQAGKIRAMEYGDGNAWDPLKTANAIFLRRGMTFQQDFAQVFMDAYRGTSMYVDFDAPEAVDAVNSWAAENTGGLITDIVQEFNPGTIAAIANAIYFADRWYTEFSPEKTEQGTFHSSQGEVDAFFMLREGEGLGYYEDDTVQAMPLPFRSGGGLLILLPKDEDAPGLLSSMTAEYFNKVIGGAGHHLGRLLLPRFSIESGTMELNTALSALGLSFLFDSEAAPFTGKLVEEDVPVWLSSATQKAVIRVDEKGTTAAAVTVMSARGAMLPEPEEPFEMICDRPFAFVLYGQTYEGTRQILFTGIVNRP